MALGIFKKAWNTTQLADLTSYFANYFTTVLNSYVTLTSFNQALANVLLLTVPKVNTANTATGVDEVTINAVSGIIEYTQTISGNDYHAFTFTNSRVDSSSVIFFSINSASAGTGGSGLPYVQSYSISSNTVTVIIANSNLNATNTSFFLNFLIVS